MIPVFLYNTQKALIFHVVQNELRFRFTQEYIFIFGVGCVYEFVSVKDADEKKYSPHKK